MTVYRFKELYEQGCEVALQEISRRKPVIKNRVKEHIEQQSYRWRIDNPALEQAKEEKQVHGEIETYYPGFLVVQDTYYVGYIKGVGPIYQQIAIDTYSKIRFAKLYDRKNALVAADMLK